MPGANSKVPRDKTLGPTFHLPSALTFAHPYICHTAIRFDLSASWGLTLKLGQPPSGPSQGSWPPNTGDLLPLAPAPDSPYRHPTTQHIGAPLIIQGVRKGRALHARVSILRFPAINPLGPNSASPAPSRWPAPLLASHPFPQAYWPPGG